MNEFLGHAYGTLALGVLTPVVEIGAQLTRTALGVFHLAFQADWPLGAARDLKVTVNLEETAIGPQQVYEQIVVTSNDIEIDVFDDTGAAADPSAIWVTVERVPR